MRTRFPAILLVIAASAAVAAAESPESDEQMWADGYVVVLGSGQSFRALERTAKRIALKSRTRYDRMDRSFGGDFDWIGRLARDGDRDAKGNVRPFVSVEWSEVYGLRRRFIVAGAVTYTLADAKRELVRYRKAVPDAYIKKFRQYMGCRS